MTKDDLKGLVILMKNDKTLLQTKKIRIHQRENLVDKLYFLIPKDYQDQKLENYNVTLLYIGQDGTVMMEILEKKDEDYTSSNGEETHMIYCLPVDSNLTKFAGDITLHLSLDYVDYAGQTESSSDDEESEDPEQIHYVLNTDETVITVLPIKDYYSVVPDSSLAEINNKIAELDAQTKTLQEAATAISVEKADDIELSTSDGSGKLYLKSNGKLIGTPIDLEDLGDALVDDNPDGLVTVVL